MEKTPESTTLAELLKKKGLLGRKEEMSVDNTIARLFEIDEQNEKKEVFSLVASGLATIALLVISCPICLLGTCAIGTASVLHAPNAIITTLIGMSLTTFALKLSKLLKLHKILDTKYQGLFIVFALFGIVLVIYHFIGLL